MLVENELKTACLHLSRMVHVPLALSWMTKLTLMQPFYCTQTTRITAVKILAEFIYSRVSFLGASAKLQKATITFKSVCPSVRMEQLVSHWKNFGII
jgi:hypothetical protein